MGWFDKFLRRPSAPVDDEVIALDGTSGGTKCSGVDKDNLATVASVPVKATSAELNTGTNDAKFATALGLTASNFTKAGPASAINAALIPASTNASKLGSPTLPFYQGHFSEILGLGLNESANNNDNSFIRIVTLFTTGASDRTITLPGGQNVKGLTFLIMKVDNGAGALILSPDSGTINGAATLRTTQQYAGAIIFSNGTNRFALLFGTWT